MNYKILIVDDQPDNLDAIIGFLEEEDQPYDILQAVSGEVALNIARSEVPNLIITDWEMPGMDGIQLIKELHLIPELDQVPIIMCTGVMITSENLKMALAAGAVDYMRKPIDKIELIARIHATLRLADSYKEIKTLNESKDKIFSIISHDLRTPVGNIESFVRWIIEQSDSYDKGSILKLLKTIHKQSSGIFQTMETLLNWAQCQAKALIFNPQKNNLIDVVTKAEELLFYSAEEKGITIKNKFENDVVGHFDENMISTVVRNLLANAIKFSYPGGKINVVCENHNESLSVCIKDKGVGITKRNLETLFDSSNYSSTYGTNSEKGSGLGLKICKDFIAMHHGEIEVKSTTNKGSKFCFTIPIHQK